MPQHDILEPATRGLNEGPTLAETIAIVERDLPGMDWVVTKRTRTWRDRTVVKYTANVLPPYQEVAPLPAERRREVSAIAHVRDAVTPQEALAKAYAKRMEAGR